MKHAVIRACALLLLSGTASAATLNEIRIDQSGSDNDEYFELSGSNNELLTGLSYLVIGDGAGGSGVVEAVVDLSAEQLDSNGLFVAAESIFTLGTANLVTSINFENSDNVTHLLVRDFSGLVNDDLDVDDDGTLDSTPWTEIVDSVGLRENDSGELLYSSTIVGPDGTFVPGHVFLCDDGWRIGSFTVGENDTPGAVNDCGGGNGGEPQIVGIPQIQSSGDTSPFVGQLVQTTGVVTADFQGGDQLRGFFMQDSVGDADDTTSDGIYVFDPDGTDVNVGDLIIIVAEVDEFFGLTELKNVVSITVNGLENIAPVMITLPETVDGDLERYEGMLVEITHPMTVAQTFFLGRYGQMTLSSPDDSGNPGRLFQPTNVFPAATVEREQLANENARRLLVLDDGQDISSLGDNPDPVPYLGLPPQVVRAGDQVSNLVGVLDYGRINSAPTPNRDYRLQPVAAPQFTNTNLRQSAPDAVAGTVSVASFNVLNYFTTLDGNGSTCGPDANQGCRGADSAEELQRQQDKLVAAIMAMDADIVGLIELENNGFGPDSAIQTLVDALNTAYGGEIYQVAGTADQQPLGTDVIVVGFIYKPAIVSPVGLPATLATGAFDPLLEDGLSRQPLAVSFEEVATGERFTAVVNHFKSKRPPSTPQNNANDDQGDGQGSWNLRRTEAANDLAAWLASDPTGIADPDVLIIGDLNAYAQEDPILALNQQGYTDLIRESAGVEAYSFIFDGQSGYLDHALANQALLTQVSGVVEWAINADEPKVIDYDLNFNPDSYYAADPYRSSDHDPVIVGLTLQSEQPPMDTDGDGVADTVDFCPMTPANANVDANGCSGRQRVIGLCDSLFPTDIGGYLGCVYIESFKAYQEGLLSQRQARRLFNRAVRRVLRLIYQSYGYLGQ